MRIGLVGPTYPFRGGIAHYDTLLYRALQTRHQVRFVSFRRQYPRWLFPGRNDRDESSRVPLIAEGALPLLDPFDPRTWWAVARELIAFAPDLTILPWWTAYWAPPYAAILACLRRAGLRRNLFLCHDVVAHDYTLVHRLASRLILRQGQAFIVHSRQEADALQAMVPGAAVRWTPHPTYAELSRGHLSRAEAQRRLRLESPVLLFFGFVRPYKGLRDLLAALPTVRAQTPATLLVVGQFWEPLHEYQSQACALGMDGCVQLVDRYVPNEEIPLYFAAADLVVLPYREATGSGVAQLALGCGRPVLTTHTGSFPEIVEDGRTGLLVPPGDPAALAEAILRFLRLPAQERAAFEERIRQQEERFSWQQLVACVEALAAELGVR
mgnify:CR=1 FL=1